MKQFMTIFKFELFSYLKNKVFVGITVFLMAVIAAVMFFPRVMAMTDADGSMEDGKYEVSGILLLSAGDTEYAEMIRESFAERFAEYEVLLTDETTEAIKKKVESGKAECAFVLDGLDSYTYYVDNLSLYDTNTETADEALESVYRMNAFIERGISREEAKKALTAEIVHSTESLGKDQMQNFFYTYIMIFALYMVILLYGQMVATNVATEKSSRAMELLITSARPTAMMFGKVIASCLAGFVQLLAVFGSSILFYNINRDSWADNYIMATVFDMPPVLLIYMLIFFVLGFFIYAFMFGAIGSMASKVEDINTSAMPVTLLFVGGFIIVMTAMSNGNVDSLLMYICSYVPFTSPMAMFTRIAMSTVPFYEIVISIAVLVGSVAAVGVISARIYRVGVLLYGKTPKLGTILKAMKKV